MRRKKVKVAPKTEMVASLFSKPGFTLALPPFILILVHNELKRTPIKVAFYSLSNTPIHNVTQIIREHARMKQVKFKT
ncbi:MAG: hypothetical protein DSY79_11730 [Chloroflexi bacterium]|nr:MAG: hypothetical protein DSY79_11730 [Chloroflexota bacterium]